MRRAVERIAGVKSIALEMDVIPPGIHQRTDTEIASVIEHHESYSGCPDQKNHAGSQTHSSEHPWGVATMQGRVQSWSEKTATEGATWSAQDMLKVDSQLMVEDLVYFFIRSNYLRRKKLWGHI